MRRLAGIPLTVEYTNTARKEFLQLAKTDGNALQEDLEILALTGIGQIEPLEGTKRVFKLRSGRTRAEFIVIQTEHCLTVIRVFYRQEGYKTKGRSRR